MGGSYGVEIPWNEGISTENVVHEPTFTPYELRLLWHTNPPFYAIWTVFIGGGGGLYQESAKGAGGKGARVINCHNFFFTPDSLRETRRIEHTTTEGTAERKMRQFATPTPFTPAPFRPFWL